MSNIPSQPPGWYYAQGDPPNTHRYWDGQAWQGEPQPIAGAQSSYPGAFPGASMAANAVTNLATVGSRYGGRLIDYIVWLVISSVVQLVVGGQSAFSLDNVDQTIGPRQIAAGLLAALAIGAYETLMVANSGATLGKKASGSRVVRADGQPMDLVTAAKRISPIVAFQVISAFSDALSFLVGFVLLGLLVAGMIMLSVDKRRQTPWDKIAGTVVEKAS